MKNEKEINELNEKIESMKNDDRNKDKSIQQLQTEINKLSNDKTINTNKIKHLEEENKKVLIVLNIFLRIYICTSNFNY